MLFILVMATLLSGFGAAFCLISMVVIFINNFGDFIVSLSPHIRIGLCVFGLVGFLTMINFLIKKVEGK